MNFLSYLYKDQKWSDYCLPIAFFSTVIILSCAESIGYLMTLIWLQFVVYLIHQTEEHFWPGGFRDFVNNHIFGSHVPAQPLTDFAVFWINIPIIWVLFPLFALFAQHIHVGYGSFLPIFGLVNAFLHCAAGIRFRCYNPGLVVNIFLQIPTSAYTLKVLFESNALTNKMGYIMLAVALFLHIAMVAYVLTHKKMITQSN